MVNKKRCRGVHCLFVLSFWCGLVPCHRAGGTPLAVLDDTCILTMTRACLGPKSSSMRFGYSYFTGHEVFNLWFVKHMLRNCTRINFNPSRCLWWGQWELKASKYHNFWRFIELAIPASLCEGPSFYFYVESPPSTFMHRLREHSCHSKFNVHSPKVYHWLIHDYGFACS
jgi:hypothetical protein